MSKIIIIGNGGGVLRAQLGDYIESNFSTIVRINQHKIKGYEKYIGSRTDVLCLNQHCYDELLLSDEERLLHNKLQLLHSGALIDEQSLDILINNKYCPSPDLNSIKKIILFTHKNLKLDSKQIHICNSTSNNSTGFKAIEYFLDHDVTIFGFDSFQNTSQYWHMFNEPITQEKMIKDCTKRYTDTHPYKQEEYFIKKWILTNKIKKL